MGELVRAGEIVAQVGEIVFAAPLSGANHGLKRDGVPVRADMKVIEIDPRGANAQTSGIGERPGRIEGVLAEINQWLDGRTNP